VSPAARECLEQGDIRLFFKGGCHVFAVALQESLAGERYELIRVACGEITAYHIYARSRQLMVDVGGFRSESDYRAWLLARKSDWGPAPPISTHPTTKECLFRADREDRENGWVNEWGLFSDPEFIEEAMNRAQRLITESDRYQASLVFKGHNLQNQMP
jgi:hypothetical protein